MSSRSPRLDKPELSQKTSGIYGLTQVPRLYEALQRALGAESSRRELIETYIRPQPGSRILDLGCGPAAILPFLGDVAYVGVDLNAEHIALARAAYGNRARFQAGDFASLQGELESTFDCVLCFGLLHHLDDQRVVELARLAHGYLRPGGRFVAVDPVFDDAQHAIARWLAAADSGRFVRRASGYGQLVGAEFPDCQIHVRHDLLRIPYSHCITTGARQQPDD